MTASLSTHQQSSVARTHIQRKKLHKARVYIDGLYSMHFHLEAEYQRIVMMLIWHSQFQELFDNCNFTVPFY